MRKMSGLLILLMLWWGGVFGQTTAVFHKKNIEINGKSFHGSVKNGRYQADCVLEYTFTKPIKSGSAYEIDNAIDNDAVELKVFYTDDDGKPKMSNWKGKLPKVKDVKTKPERVDGYETDNGRRTRTP